MLRSQIHQILAAQAFCFLTCFGAIATLNSDTQIEGSTLICKKGDDVISINAKDSGDERIWISKKNSSTGTELSIKSFSRGNCESCFEVRASSDFIGQTVQINLSSIEKGGKQFLRASFSQFGDRTDEAQYDCKKH